MIILFFQSVLGLLFLVLSMSNLIGSNNSKDKFSDLNVPLWFMYVTGLVQMIGGLTMILGIWNPLFAAFSGFWILAIMTGAVTVRIRSGENLKELYVPIIIGAVSLLVLVINLIKL